MGEERSGWPALFEAAFKLSANPMVLLGTDHAIVDVNDASEVTFGNPRHDVVGIQADVLVAPDSQRRLAEVWKVLDRGGRVTTELDWIRGDHRLARVQFAALSTVVQGRALILCVVLDSRLRPMHGAGDAGEPTALTTRELEIVSQIAMGRRAQDIAEALVISPATVRTHVRNAMNKLGARSQAQLVAIVISEGLLDPRHLSGV